MKELLNRREFIAGLFGASVSSAKNKDQEQDERIDQVEENLETVRQVGNHNAVVLNARVDRIEGVLFPEKQSDELKA